MHTHKKMSSLVSYSVGTSPAIIHGYNLAPKSPLTNLPFIQNVCPANIHKFDGATTTHLYKPHLIRRRTAACPPRLGVIINKDERNNKTEHSLTKESFQLPDLEKQTLQSTPVSNKTVQYSTSEALHKQDNNRFYTKESAPKDRRTQEWMTNSNSIGADRRLQGSNHSTMQAEFVARPITPSTKDLGELVRKLYTHSGGLGSLTESRCLRSEYTVRFDKKKKDEGGYNPTDTSVPTNIITCERYGGHRGNLGKALQSDNYCAWPVDSDSDRYDHHKIAQNFREKTSIACGDRDKVFHIESLTRLSYRKPSLTSTKADVPLFNKTSFKLGDCKSLNSSNKLISTAQSDFQYAMGKPSSPAGRAQDTSSILQGESDPLRARERINSTTARSSYYAPSADSYTPIISTKKHHFRLSQFRLGSVEYNPEIGHSTMEDSYVPHAQSPSSTIPPPKDSLAFTYYPIKDISMSTMKETYPEHKEADRKNFYKKSTIDLVSQWQLPYMGPPTYTTTQKTSYSPYQIDLL